MTATWTLTRTLATPYAEAVPAIKEAPAEQGFGVLTEVDPDAKQLLSAMLDALAPRRPR